jgi:transcription antitermination factor NusG
MSASGEQWGAKPLEAGTEPKTDGPRWYAVHTRARHEKMVAERLQELGFTTFLPLVKETRRWSDRKKVVEFPLFGCYVFVRFAASNPQRLRLCQTDGVLRIVGVKGQGIAIPDEQVDAVRAVLSGSLAWSNHPFLKIGQRVRICGGALEGVEGVLTSRNGDKTLIISVDAIQRSIAVSVEGYRVEPVSR